MIIEISHFRFIKIPIQQYTNVFITKQVDNLVDK